MPHRHGAAYPLGITVVGSASRVTELLDHPLSDDPTAIRSVARGNDGLLRFPLLGKQGAIEGTRERLVTRFPYRIVYTVDDDRITVLRVVHTARQWP
jgi:plasmid stabilization system protein ParE